ncbi:MAG: hypothetical protein ACP5HU_02085 [Phycisphaerae bacterium]
MKAKRRFQNVVFTGLFMSAVFCGLVFCPVAAAQESLVDVTGELAEGDQKLPKGEYSDEHSFEVEAGQTIQAVVKSDDFDTFLILRSPSGKLYTNDDWKEQLDTSRVDVFGAEQGRWQATVTSFGVGEEGDYSLKIEQLPAEPAHEAPEPGESGVVLRRKGWLLPGGKRLPKGEIYEEYSFELEENVSIRVKLNSEGFDTFLVLRSPSGQQWVNDDWQEGRDSRIELVTSEAGEWTAMATSYAPAETGAFDLTVEQLGGDDALEAPPEAGVEATLLEETGSLDSDCEKLPGGEFFQRHTFRVRSGQPVRVVMSSDEFDTYILLQSPSGRHWENDDWQGRSDMSRLDLVTTEPGEWTVITTSYAAGETGDYDLTIEQVTEGELKPQKPIGPESF